MPPAPLLRPHCAMARAIEATNRKIVRMKKGVPVRFIVLCTQLLCRPGPFARRHQGQRGTVVRLPVRERNPGAGAQAVPPATADQVRGRQEQRTLPRTARTPL
ncbi:hypothetical protein GCM10009760_13730 [Kitasatospora kazusensis]|uniref:Uncharacterized protein n=1 Tax=Kitasatospora kazusensis TaxID=407974 RepID=A0ABN2Z1E2_9ACTN